MITPGLKPLGLRLSELAARDPNRRVISVGDRWLTLSELDQRSNRLSAGLSSLGVAHGDRVALIMPTAIEMVETIFACAKLGAIIVPLNAFLKGEFLRYQLTDADPVVAVGDDAGVQAVSELRSDLPGLKSVIGVSASSSRADADFHAITADHGEAPAVEVRLGDPLAIFYTSGTTGMPKGCVISNGYAFHGTRAHYYFGYTRPGDLIFTAMPLFHAAAFSSMMNTMGGMECSISLEPEFRASVYLATAARRGATSVRGVGAMAVALLKTPPSEADRSHRIERAHFFPLGRDLQAQFEERFRIQLITGAYGQTECNPAVHMSYEDRHHGTAGKAVPWIDLKVVDDDDLEVRVGQVGEIVVRNREPYGIFSGYWRKDAATAGAWRNLFHHTGDYGRLDEDGYLTFVDRKKDALRRRGENVSSLELEQAIITHPAVQQVAVHAVASDLTEDDIKVCVVLAPGKALELGDLFEFLAANLPYYAVPRYAEVMAELPTNAVGRVQKHRLRERGNGPDTWDFTALGLTVRRDQRR